MIGELIAELRKDLGMKQTDVAAHLGVSTGTISNYECGRYEPDLETVRQLSRLFNVTSNYLLELTDDKYTALRCKGRLAATAHWRTAFLFCNGLAKRIRGRWRS